MRLISNAAELSDYDEEDDVLIDNETAHDDEDGFYGDKDNRFTEDMVHAFDDKSMYDDIRACTRHMILGFNIPP